MRTAPGGRSRISLNAWFTWSCDGEQLPGAGKQSGSTAIGEKAEVTNADEAPRQHVLNEPPQELLGRQRHLALFLAVRIILPAKGDTLAVESQQTMVADSD